MKIIPIVLSFILTCNVWAGLNISGSNSGAGISDGDKGEVIVSSNGEVWTIKDSIPVTGWTLTAPIISGSHSTTLGNGSWATYAVPYFRPTETNKGIAFDLMPNGTIGSEDAHIDICSTDITADSSNFEALELKKTATAAHIGTKKLGTGTVRKLSINENGGDVVIGASTTTTSGAQVNIYETDDQPPLGIQCTAAAGYTQMLFIGTGRTFTMGVGNASETGLTLANKFFIYDANGSTVRLSLDSSGLFTFTGTALFSEDVMVPDESYNLTAWNSNLEVPTKNAVRDQFEALSTLTATHASPSTTNPLSPTWIGQMHTVWYGATGTINLPAASGYAGRKILIYNTGAFTVTIDSNASEVIVRDGNVQTGGVSMTLSSGAGNYVALISDGVRWVTLDFKGTLSVGS